MKPFDIVSDLSFGKKGLVGQENEGDYIPFLTNKAFSYYPDTIFYANEMNTHFDLDKKLQHDYYLNAIRKSKRFSKWHKKSETAENYVCQYYQCNKTRAKEYLKVLNHDQLNIITKFCQQQE